MNEAGNPCVFSPDRVYRYTLVHRWPGLFDQTQRLACWIALNPSTADENRLDPTLRRIRGYSMKWGYTGFVMLNAFALRSTDPRALTRVDDPVGPENDAWLLRETEKADRVFCCWGAHARLGGRQEALLRLLKDRPLYYLRLTSGGFPCHPLYLPGDLEPVYWNR